MKKPLLERFWPKVAKSDGCWLWTAKLNADGYGSFNVVAADGAYRPLYAHRVAYELFVGPIPPKMEVDHLCRVRNCVNPAHLEMVTRAENVRRALAYRPEGCGGGWLRLVSPEEMPAHMKPAVICRKGKHPMTEENVLVEVSGLRRCRECKRERQRKEYREGRHHSAPSWRQAQQG